MKKRLSKRQKEKQKYRAKDESFSKKEMVQMVSGDQKEQKDE